MTRKAYLEAVGKEISMLNVGQLCPGFQAPDPWKKNASVFFVVVKLAAKCGLKYSCFGFPWRLLSSPSSGGTIFSVWCCYIFNKINNLSRV